MSIMYDPSMRVLTVLELLQAKERVTAPELAERLEVSPRTVQRYVARLQDLGVPVSSTRGRGAAYRLKPSFRMPPLMFSAEEAFTVALGLHALQHIGLAALAPAVVGVETKLERVLPTAIWGRTRALSGALRLERQPWIEAVDSAIINELAGAIEARLEVRMRYENYGRIASERTVRPLGLVRDTGIWFLAAFCLLRQDLRLFRADRIADLHKTQVAFEPPAQFDVQDFTTERLHATPARFDTEVWLEVSPETIRYELVPPRAKLTVEGVGMVLRCGVNNLERHAARLLEFQCRIEIRTPPELKTAFGSVAARARQVFEQ
jgi:predicted DNA-binding transcriptional regulator YafY